MGNYTTKNEEVLSSDQIVSNIRDVFNMNKVGGFNNSYSDTIEWTDNDYKSNNHAKHRNFVSSLKRYENYRPSKMYQKGGDINNNTLNKINLSSEGFSEISESKLGNLASIINKNMGQNGGYSLSDATSDITEFEQLKTIINYNKQKGGENSNIQTKEQSNYKELSSDMSEIAKLKQLIKNQIGGENGQVDMKELSSDKSEIKNLKNIINHQLQHGAGCGCGGSNEMNVSATSKNSIDYAVLKGGNLSALSATSLQPVDKSVLNMKGGNKDDKNDKKETKEKKDNEKTESDEFDDDDEDDLDEDEDDNDDEENDEDLEEESEMERMTKDGSSEDSSDSNNNETETQTESSQSGGNKYIKVVPFYSSSESKSSISASAYFRKLNN